MIEPHAFLSGRHLPRACHVCGLDHKPQRLTCRAIQVSQMWNHALGSVEDEAARKRVCPAANLVELSDGDCMVGDVCPPRLGFLKKARRPHPGCTITRISPLRSDCVFPFSFVTLVSHYFR